MTSVFGNEFAARQERPGAILMSTQTSGAEHVEQVIERVHEELESLLSQRAVIIKRIGTIKPTILGLANLFGDNVVGEELLELVDHRPPASSRPLLTQEVCQEIRRRNPALLARQKAPLASVSTVLHRLASYGQARVLANDRGQRTWQWVTDNDEPAPDSSSEGVPSA